MVSALSLYIFYSWFWADHWNFYMPPPIHQTFWNKCFFVVCSFVPRLYDYHPNAIPAPYNHSNIDSDEVLYYVDGVLWAASMLHEEWSPLHPAGYRMGHILVQWRRVLVRKKQKELAVMVDTFRPLITKQALEIENKNYVMSWAD